MADLPASSTYSGVMSYHYPQAGLIRRSLPNMAHSMLVHEPAKIYPYHLLLITNYRLPADVDRCNLEVRKICQKVKLIRKIESQRGLFFSVIYRTSNSRQYYSVPDPNFIECRSGVETTSKEEHVCFSLRIKSFFLVFFFPSSFRTGKNSKGNRL